MTSTSKLWRVKFISLINNNIVKRNVTNQFI